MRYWRLALAFAAAASALDTTSEAASQQQHAVCSDRSLPRLSVSSKHATSVPHKLCVGDRLTDDVDVVKRELQRRIDSLQHMRLLLVGGDVDSALVAQRASVDGIARDGLAQPPAGRPETALPALTRCVTANASFAAERLGLTKAAGSPKAQRQREQQQQPAASLYRDILPDSITWCFQAVVSSDLEVVESAVEAHSPDALLVVRPAARYLTTAEHHGTEDAAAAAAAAAKGKGTGGKRSPTVLSWLLSWVPYQGAVPRVHERAVERTASLLDELRERTAQHPVLVVTGMEAARGGVTAPQRAGGATATSVAATLREALRRHVPELVLAEGDAPGALAAAHRALYTRKLLHQADAVRELAAHHALLREAADARDERASERHPAARTQRLQERLQGYVGEQQAFEQAQAAQAFYRNLELAGACALSLGLLAAAARIVATLVAPASSVLSAVAALGQENHVARVPGKSALQTPRPTT